MCPGLPRASNQFCDRVGRVMNYGDGVYGGMFVCADAMPRPFLKPTRAGSVEAGLACIPAKSQYALLIRDLLDWSRPKPERLAQGLAHDRRQMGQNDPCPDGALSPFNIDAKLNGAYIAFGLLFGQRDFAKTMEIATRCGQDSDCNPSSAAGVLGVVLGYDQIPDSFKSDIPALENKKFAFTDYSFNDIVKSTEVRALKIVQATGGKVTDQEIGIRIQKPKAPKLEQWNPGIPYQRFTTSDPCWSYSGAWQTENGAKVSTSKGNDATLEFNGVAVAIMGELSPNGGRQTVFLDGKKVESADAYIGERTHDHALWHVYGLKSGSHTVRLVTTDEVDARSKGKRIALHEAVIYRADQQ